MLYTLSSISELRSGTVQRQYNSQILSASKYPLIYSIVPFIESGTRDTGDCKQGVELVLLGAELVLLGAEQIRLEAEPGWLEEEEHIRHIEVAAEEGLLGRVRTLAEGNLVEGDIEVEDTGTEVVEELGRLGNPGVVVD